MENTYRKEYFVTTSSCDAQGLLGVRNIFDIYMDLATEHAFGLGVSYYDMLPRRCFWVAVKTRTRLYERPKMGTLITAETWPGKPSLAKVDRFYRLTDGDKILSEGRTEWAVQDIDTGAVRRLDSIGYPHAMEPRAERLCAEPFTRFKNTPASPETVTKTYTVGSMDIDLGRHMNNVAYIRMLLGTFTTAELAEMDISEVEISYRSACFEGQELQIQRTAREDGYDFRVLNPEGDTAVHALIRYR